MITSTSNERVKEARKLHQRRHRQASGLLLLEGLRLINDAAQSGAQITQLFYDPAQVAATPAASSLLASLRQRDSEAIPCAPTVIAALADTVTPQGMIAVVALPKLPMPTAPTFTLILDQVRDPGNAGTLLRSAEAAGVELVIFASDAVDPFNEKTLRAGMGAHFRLPIRMVQHWADVQQYLHPQQQLFLAAGHTTTSYDQIDWRAPACLIIGGEANGASAAAQRQATPIAIPMRAPVESLNAAMAGAIILFEAARQRRNR